MCGFLGAADFNKGIDEYLPALRKGMNAISHRGPDGSKEMNFGKVYLGHNRLSIIDLSTDADQPLKSINSDAYLIFNGEIYNYKELRKELSGINFKTNSDTEVLLEGYLKFGIDFFRKLRGIYSFSIFDNRSEPKLVMYRDPAGVKPLYFFAKNGFCIYGSEIKALLPTVRKELSVNVDAVKCYLNLGYCPEPYTVYSEINALKPGMAVEVKKDSIRKIQCIEYDFENENTFSYRDNQNHTERILSEAVRRNLVADVEVAVALSGGIDSSLIYAYANESDSSIRGLTVKFDDKDYNEADISKIYSGSLKGRHEFVEVQNVLNLETLDMVLKNFDQPYADSSAINVYYLTRATKSISKVLIGGDGGDELYNGYPSMTWLVYLYKLTGNSLGKRGGEAILGLSKKFATSSQRRMITRMLALTGERPVEMLYDWHSWFPRTVCYEGKSPFKFDTSDGLRIYETVFEESAPAEFRNFVAFDYFRKTMLSDYLRKTDMMSMLNSIEYRVPFLDEDLTEFALTIPFEQKSSLRETKKILRAIHRKKFPAQTSKMPKKGFTIPLDKALSREDFRIIEDRLMRKDNYVHEFVSKEYINFLFRALNEKNDQNEMISRAGIYQRILMLYSLGLWHDAR